MIAKTVTRNDSVLRVLFQIHHIYINIKEIIMIRSCTLHLISPDDPSANGTHN